MTTQARHSRGTALEIDRVSEDFTSLRDAWNADNAESQPDTAQAPEVDETPVESADDTGTPEPQEGDTGSPATAAASGDEDALGVRAALEKLRTQFPPEVVDAVHEQYRQEFQRGITPRLQEAAEIRKRFEPLTEVPDQEVQGFLQLRQLASTDPQTYAQVLRQEYERVTGQAQQPQSPAGNQFELDEWASDTEKALYYQNQQLQQQMQELLQWRQQEQTQRVLSAADSKLNDLEKTYGQIPFEERQAAKQWAIQRGIPDQADFAWKALYAEQRALQRGREEERKVLMQKRQLGGAPSGITSRTSNAPKEPGSLKEAAALDGWPS